MVELRRFFELLHLGVWILLGGGVLFIGVTPFRLLCVILPLGVGLLAFRCPQPLGRWFRLTADLLGIAGLVATTGMGSSPFAMFGILPLVEGALLFSRALALILLVGALVFLAAVDGDLTSRYFLAGLYLLATALGLYVRERVSTLATLYERLRLDRRTILESLESGVMAFGRDGSLLYDNPAARRLLVPGAYDVFRKEALRALRQGIRDSELRVGNRVYGVGWTILPEEGGVLAIFQDITEKRAMEARLKALDRWATVGSFASHLAHEIRSAVMTLRGALELWDRADSERRARYRRHVDHALTHLQNLVEAFLTYARVGSTLSLAEYSLGECARMLSEEVGYPIRVQGSGKVVTDFRRVGWIVRNLVENARRYGTRVDVVILGPNETLEDPLARVSAGEDAWAVVVRDDGPGIPESVRAQMFEPFYTTEPSGFGLGLAIVKETAEQLGGRVAVWSEPGEGSLFAVFLPVRPSVTLSQEVHLASNGGD